MTECTSCGRPFPLETAEPTLSLSDKPPPELKEQTPQKTPAKDHFPPNKVLKRLCPPPAPKVPKKETPTRTIGQLLKELATLELAQTAMQKELFDKLNMPKRCYHCRELGHVKRDCPAKSETIPSIKCERCRERGHHVSACEAGPPQRKCFCGALHWRYDCPFKTIDSDNLV